MAGFGTLSLAQTVIGTLLDQRAVVLYKQPKVDLPALRAMYGTNTTSSITRDIINDLWGNQFYYEELFSGLADEIGNVNKVLNVTGANPYGISYMSARVNVESDLCDHPVEKGTIITDASIIQPVSAQVEVAMPTFFAERIYKTMLKMQQKKEDKIILQTKYGVYKDLVIQSFQYSLDAKTVDRSLFTLSLREVKEVQSYGTFGTLASNQTEFANASDANTIGTGTQVAEA